MSARYSKEDADLVRKSGLFDANWYLKEYPDVVSLGIDPLDHFMWLGWRLERNPGAQFSTTAYLDKRPDVRLAEVNPLVHYLSSGGNSAAPFTVTVGAISVGDNYPNLLLCAHAAGMQLFGGERSFLDMVKALSQLAINLYVTLPSLENIDYVDQIKGMSSGVIKVPPHRWRHNADISGLVAYYERLIKELSIDLVYANTITLRAPQLAARNLGRKTICHVREMIEYDRHLSEGIALDAPGIVRDVIERSDAIIANSRTTASAFNSSKLFEVPNTVDPAQLDLPNSIDGIVRYGIISSNLPKKGIADFVEIARICEAQSIPGEFVVIGPDNDFIGQLRKENLPGNLRLAGYSASPTEALKQVNVLLSLSHFQESFGRTVAEALAARRPVIAYDWGAVAELISDNETGFLVPYLDQQAVVRQIKVLSDDPRRIATLGEAGRKWIRENIAPDIYSDKLSHSLASLLGPLEWRADTNNPDEQIRISEDLAAKSPGTDQNGGGVTIIVPVYNAPDDVAVCLASLERWTNLNRHRVLIIDDGSTDARIRPLLEIYRDRNGFTVLTNAENLGYTCTINKGIAWAGDDDIILLNSDTMVTPYWLEGILQTAADAKEIGTVTAMSDNAGAFSFPVAHQHNLPPTDLSKDAWAQAIVRQTHHCEPVEVPTGNGFCLFIRRRLFAEIGTFDADKFPRGYGEENEFCLRALKHGWRHVITPRSYVYHARSKSFGDEKVTLAAEGAAVVNANYPSYMAKVRKAFQGPAMMALRDAAAATQSAIERERSAAISVQLELAKKGEELVDWDAVSEGLPTRVDGRRSFIVCAFNNAGLTLKCLDSLLNSGIAPEDEIILVDNGSNRETFLPVIEFVQKHSRIRLIENSENLNFAIGNNIGFAASTGEFVIFLNNDTEVHEGWLPPLIEGLDDPYVLGTQPRLTFPDGNIQCAGIVFSGRSALGYALYTDIPGDDPKGNKPRRLRAVTAACVAMRARDFAAARGFDPIFINGQEDVDLCLRLGLGDTRFLYVPQSHVTHYEGKTTGRGKYVMQNRRVFVARWQDGYGQDDESYYAADQMQALDYRPDKQELHDAGIGLWRPQIIRPMP